MYTFSFWIIYIFKVYFEIDIYIHYISRKIINLLYFHRLQNYHFKFKRAPDKTVTELFGHNTDGKWANILYVGQIAEKDIQALENNTRLRNKVSRTIDGSNQIQFQNEIFCINKVR